MAETEPGLANSALEVAADQNEVNEDPSEIVPEPDTPGAVFLCFGEPLSPSAESEYDDILGVPDSLSVISVSGDVPVLVEGAHVVDKSGDQDAVIPFHAVYSSPVKFKAIQRKVFIPGIEIHVKIIDNERSVTTHLLNPNLYTILLEHGPFKWTVRKRYKHFQHLHQQLRMFRASLNIPFPTRSHRERRTSYKNNANIRTSDSVVPRGRPKTKGKPGRKSSLPRFPRKPEALVPYEGLQLRMQQLEDYLYNLINISFYRNHFETVSFLEVSHLSFIADLGDKGKEGLVLKRTGSTQPGQAGCNVCGLIQNAICIRCNYFCTDVVCARWRSRWFFIKDTCFGYVRPKDGSLRCVMLFDQGFEVSTGMYSTGLRNGLQILNNSRQIVIKCWTRRKGREWMEHLKLIANNQARDFTSPNPNSSFAPLRSSTLSSWFVDASEYMSIVADALEGAKEEIYIADWWLSPEIFMKRPALNGDYWRLDKILKRKAKQGIKIFILLYKEVEMALGINSFYSKQRLVFESGDNLKVFRHPDHARVGVFLWAHHEKIVVVDQTYAFLGGIDLCYGRWDDNNHRLTDLGSVSQPSSHVPKTLPPLRPASAHSGDFGMHSMYSLAKASNIVGLSIITSGQSTGDGTELPELKPGDHLLMPVPTIELPELAAAGMPDVVPDSMKGNTPVIYQKNMLDKLKDNVKQSSRDFLNKIYSGNEDTPDDVDFSQNNYDNVPDKNMFFHPGENNEQKIVKYSSMKKIQEDFVNSLDGQAKYFVGKDYCNFIIKDFANLDLPYVDLVDRGTTPRMPWHDIAAVVCGEAARDVSRHFIQRWNAVKLEKARDNPLYPYLLPKSYKNIEIDENFLNLNEPLKRVTCQVLRSVSSWSCGFLEPDTVEQSIHEAYVETITRAQHYVYIENQFFITLAMGSLTVRNQVGEALYKRIIRAHRLNFLRKLRIYVIIYENYLRQPFVMESLIEKEKAVFRVFVVMPLLPAFEGEIGAPSGISLHAITHWNYQSINRGKDSIIARLKEAGIQHPGNYISFHGLRTHSILNGEPVTELIYVHSKLLIADDRTVICGSANINDRSLIGKRDSEIAVIIQDEAFEEGTMNGEVFPSGLYAGTLRKHLFREHLGLLNAPSFNQLNDPVIDCFWFDVWQRISRDNTEVYDSIFKCIPSDQVESFQALRKYQEDPPMSKTEPTHASRMCAQNIQGHLVDFPLRFLASEILTPPSTSKEGIMPTSLWT